jgi:hypothetical protein
MRCLPARGIGRDGAIEIKGWLASKPKEAVAKPWPSFAAARKKTTEIDLEVGIGDALATYDFVFKEYRHLSSSTNNQGGDEHGFK